MNKFRLRVKKMILETFLYEEEFRVDAEKNEAKEALFAFMKGEAKVNKVEDTTVEDISNAMEKNDYSNQGHSHIIEEPSISITYKHKDFYISAQIDKDYVYRTENSDSDFPGYEEIKLNNVEITNNSVTLYNENGNEFVFTLAELGNETFKHLEKTLKKYLK